MLTLIYLALLLIVCAALGCALVLLPALWWLSRRLTAIEDAIYDCQMEVAELYVELADDAYNGVAVAGFVDEDEPEASYAP
jgi:hypothetical protein